MKARVRPRERWKVEGAVYAKRLKSQERVRRKDVRRTWSEKEDSLNIF